MKIEKNVQQFLLMLDQICEYIRVKEFIIKLQKFLKRKSAVIVEVFKRIYC